MVNAWRMPERLWAPWRLEYVADARDEKGCVFCAEAAGASRRPGPRCPSRRARAGSAQQVPVHVRAPALAPVRHVSELSELTDEASALHELSVRGIEALRAVYRPDAFNVGWNLGEEAGGSISAHLHQHVVPRWAGDTNFMPVLADVKVLPEHLLRTRSASVRRGRSSSSRRTPTRTPCSARMRPGDSTRGTSSGSGRGPCRGLPSSSACAYRTTASRRRSARFGSSCARAAARRARGSGWLRDAGRPARALARARVRSRPGAVRGRDGAPPASRVGRDARRRRAAGRDGRRVPARWRSRRRRSRRPTTSVTRSWPTSSAASASRASAARRTSPGSTASRSRRRTPRSPSTASCSSGRDTARVARPRRLPRAGPARWEDAVAGARRRS